ncbi:related to theta class glutathione S-transferase [Fusarium torulosum]|uniref:glutathione transferase n=1 Tax=Fusarium torulosum TaxID=33205 RepID=A0AAE8MN21_9HYPO|nr:related to theta class glutathione S-transferase [Fusarium torulosum]
MSPPLKPLILWGGVDGPNPPKVAMVLEELQIPWEPKYLPLSEVKKPDYVAINPNGRLPTLQDPNTGITVWESGAILEYLVMEYDKEHKLSFPLATPEFYHCQQWLIFQVSGQGPYYGQVYFFKHYHSEKVDSVIERFAKEVRRVSAVLDAHLANHQYLVGEKCTYADIAWIPWQVVAASLVGEELDLAKEFPHLQAWLDRLTSRPAVKKVLDERAERMAKRGVA